MPSDKSESYWEERFRKAEEAFHQLKSMTKQVPAWQWTADYRALAEAIHNLGRDVFYVDGKWLNG